ncbi:MAG: non-heme iron oxygenase ferredoxin subunit [Mariniblastus sp.]|nr:non-heme iron oxygenase ferredoxin subunit [Mariniblastus sp.]
MANEFHQVSTTSEIEDGSFELCEVDDRLVIVFRVGSDFYCIDDICTHDGGTLSDGEVSGCEIACPRHGARFDIRNGRALSMPATQDTRSHQVKIEGDEVWVRLGSE